MACSNHMPVNLSVGKMLYAALREAFFAWCKDTMAGITALLGETGIIDNKIKAQCGLVYWAGTALYFKTKCALLMGTCCF
jgi:hypothetical protein